MRQIVHTILGIALVAEPILLIMPERSAHIRRLFRPLEELAGPLAA